MKVENVKAYDKVIKARTSLILHQPFFGTLALQLKLVEVTLQMQQSFYRPITTMAVDGIHMYYWPEFVLDLSEEELVGVVAHEVMHCAFKHMTRRHHRDPHRWNIAGDHVINLELKKANFTLPEPNLCDPQYENMSTEEVYARLPEPPKQGGKGKGKGEGGEGNSGQEGDLDSGGCGGVMDASMPSDKAKAEEVERDWEANVRMAVNVAKGNNAGQLPGYLERLVKELKAPRVSWRELTRQFIDQSNTKDYSFKRPNRRYIHSGMIMPGLVSDALHELVMVIDCSGSISNEMMKSYVSEVAGALDEGTTDKLIVVYADDGVRQVDEYLPGDIVECKTLGMGGTDFRATFNWIRENAPDAAAVIYLTDMMTSSFGEEPDCPTLWAAYLPEHQLAHIKVPFGTVIPIDSSEG